MRNFIQISFALIIFAVAILFNTQVTPQPQALKHADVQAEARRDDHRLINMGELWNLYYSNGGLLNDS